MKIGDKVKFDTYIPMNIINNKYMRKTLTGAPIRNAVHGIARTETTVTYKTKLIKEHDLLEGIYVGHFFKKLNRKYKLSTKEELEEQERQRIATRRFIVRSFHTPADITHYSTNPRRLDDPRRLDKIAIVNIGKKMIGVPIGNILKNDPNFMFRII